MAMDLHDAPAGSSADNVSHRHGHRRLRALRPYRRRALVSSLSGLTFYLPSSRINHAFHRLLPCTVDGNVMLGLIFSQLGLTL
jgi:hypothetical protein